MSDLSATVAEVRAALARTEPYHGRWAVVRARDGEGYENDNSQIDDEAGMIATQIENEAEADLIVLLRNKAAALCDGMEAMTGIAKRCGETADKRTVQLVECRSALAKAEAERDAIQETLTEVEHNVAIVYCHITDGAISKCNTCAADVKAVADDCVTKLVDQECADANAEIEGLTRFLSGEQVGVSTDIGGGASYGYGKLDINGSWQYPVPEKLVALRHERDAAYARGQADENEACAELAEHYIPPRQYSGRERQILYAEMGELASAILARRAPQGETEGRSSFITLLPLKDPVATAAFIAEHQDALNAEARAAGFSGPVRLADTRARIRLTPTEEGFYRLDRPLPSNAKCVLECGATGHPVAVWIVPDPPTPDPADYAENPDPALPPAGEAAK